jgi:hypothetical protein
MKVVERSNARNDVGKRGGNLRIEVVGVMQFPVDRIGVDFCVEGLPELSGGAGEFERGLAFGHAGNRESVLLQPARDSGDVGIIRSVEFTELLRREPLVIRSSAARVYVLKELAQRVLALRRALQQQQHALCGEGIRNPAKIVLRLCERVHVSLQGDADAFVHWLRDAGSRLAVGLDSGSEAKNGNDGD